MLSVNVQPAHLIVVSMYTLIVAARGIHGRGGNSQTESGTCSTEYAIHDRPRRERGPFESDKTEQGARGRTAASFPSGCPLPGAASLSVSRGQVAQAEGAARRGQAATIRRSAATAAARESPEGAGRGGARGGRRRRCHWRGIAGRRSASPAHSRTGRAGRRERGSALACVLTWG